MFYADKSKRDGLSHSCRDCAKGRSKEWYERNTDRAQAAAKEWRRQNPERFRQRQREWDRKHPKEKAETENRRRARLRDAIVEKIDPWAIYQRDGGRCHICGRHVKKSEMSLDHLVPISRGGDHVALNVRLAHLKCNIRRGPGRTPAQLLLA